MDKSSRRIYKDLQFSMFKTELFILPENLLLLHFSPDQEMASQFTQFIS